MPAVLGYWKIRGLVQHIRLLLEYVEEPYEEVVYANHEDWYPKGKEEVNMIFANLPYYIDDKVKLVQSNVILRYIADKHGLSGGADENKYEVMAMEQNVHDFRMAFAYLCYDKNFENLKQKFIEETLPERLGKFSQYLGEKNWFNGDGITYPDFHFYELLDALLYLDPHCLDKFPNLQAYHSRFESLPQIKRYMESPRFMKSPLNFHTAIFNN